MTLLDPDGVKRDYLASVAGLLKAKDLAVLKIDAPASILQPATIGQSSSVRVGQQVLAIGNPFGFDHTLTTGAISGLDRVIQSQVGARARLLWPAVAACRACQPRSSLVNTHGGQPRLLTATTRCSVPRRSIHMSRVFGPGFRSCQCPDGCGYVIMRTYVHSTRVRPSAMNERVDLRVHSGNWIHARPPPFATTYTAPTQLQLLLC